MNGFLNFIYYDIQANKGKLGDLDSGNHFLDALESYTDDKISFLIHTGSRNESKLVDDLIDRPHEINNKINYCQNSSRRAKE